MTSPYEPTTPIENVPRGTLLALLVIPVGIALWLLIWNLGFIASIVAFLVAFGAGFLYRLGAGVIQSSAGVVRVIVITVVTLVAAIVAGYAWDVAKVYDSEGGIPFTQSLFMPEFWQDTFAWMFDSSNTVDLLLALAFGALGCFSTLRGLRQQAKAANQAPAVSSGATFAPEAPAFPSAASAPEVPAAEPQDPEAPRA